MNSSASSSSPEISKSNLLGANISELNFTKDQSNLEKISLIRAFFKSKNIEDQRGSLYMQKFVLNTDTNTLNYVENGGRYSLWDFLEMNFSDFTVPLMDRNPSKMLLNQTQTTVDDLMTV